MALLIERPSPLTARGIDLVKPLEHIRQVCFADTGARVLDGQYVDLTKFQARSHIEPAAVRNMAQGVREQVLDQLLDTVGIGDHLISSFINVKAYFNVAPLHFALVTPDDVFKQPPDRKDSDVQVDHAVLKSC